MAIYTKVLHLDGLSFKLRTGKRGRPPTVVWASVDSKGEILLFNGAIKAVSWAKHPDYKTTKQAFLDYLQKEHPDKFSRLLRWMLRNGQA